MIHVFCCVFLGEFQVIKWQSPSLLFLNRKKAEHDISWLGEKSPKTCFWTRLRDVSCPFDLIWIRGYVCSEKAFAYGNIATCQTVPPMRQWFNTKRLCNFYTKKPPATKNNNKILETWLKSLDTLAETDQEASITMVSTKLRLSHIQTFFSNPALGAFG